MPSVRARADSTRGEAMAGRLIVQASGAMFSTIEPDAWAYVFGLYVTDETGVPVTGLKKSSFAVFELTTIGQLSVYMVTDVNADFPSYKIPGVYRVQTTDVLGNAAPSPQEFVFAVRVTTPKPQKQGVATVPITYLGKPQ